jgi:uncharacterized protein YdeI (YjbR/CyaY-like superfamily)
LTGQNSRRSKRRDVVRAQRDLPGERLKTREDLPTVAFPSSDAFEKWLAQNHDAFAGIWLKLAKKESGIPSVSYAEALDVALCFGWIDGQKGALDDEHWLQRFTPRRAKSKWSKINCTKATELIQQKRMRRPGLKQIELAKQDGRWDAAYASQRKAEVPEDLERALRKNKKARAFFTALDSANRYAILYRLHHANQPEAREAMIAKFVEMLSRGNKIHERK